MNFPFSLTFTLQLLSNLLNYVVSESCYLRNPGGDCFLCPFDSYFQGVLHKQDYKFFVNDSLSSENSLKQTCQKRISTVEIPKRKILVSSSEDLLDCLGPELINMTYFDLIGALTEESLLLAPFLYSELTILLVGLEPHYVLPSQAGGRLGIEFFRRQNIKINIEPLFCSSFNISGCLKDNKTAEVVLKHSNFFIFISNSVTIRNVHISGADLFLWGSSSANIYQNCINTKELCCSEETKVKEIDGSVGGLDGACRLGKYTVLGYSESLYYANAFFNLETLNDDINAPTPSISLVNCIFENIQYLEPLSQTGILKLVNFGSKIAAFRSVLFTKCYFMTGIFTALSKNLEQLASSILSLTLANTTISEYNAYKITSLEEMSTALIFMANINFTLSISQCLVVKPTANNAVHSLIYLKNDLQLKPNSIFIKELQILEANSFPLFYFYNIIGELDSLNIQNVLAYSWNIFISNCELNMKNLIFYDVSGKISDEGKQASIMSVDHSKLFINGFHFFFSFSAGCDFTSGFLWIENFILLNINFKGSFLDLTEMQAYISLGNVESPLGDSYIFSMEKGSFNITGSHFSNLNVPYVFNPNLIDSFIAKGCMFKNSTSLQYITAPSHVYRKLTLENCSFIEISFQTFFSFYISSPFKNLLLVTGCTFIDVKINNIFFELCCTDFEISGSTFERVIMDEVNGMYMMTMESSGNYVIKDSYFKNYGFNNIEKIDWQLVAFVYYTNAFLWYGDSLTVKNIYCELDPEFYLPGGFIGAEKATYYVYIENYTLVSKAKDFDRYVKGIYSYQVKNITVLNSRFTGLGCTGIDNSVTFAHDNGVVSLINNPYFGGEDKNEFYARLDNLTFDYCLCRFGGAFSLVNYNNIFIENLIIKRVLSQMRGGGIMIYSSRTTFIKNLFIEDSRSLEGSFIFLDSVKMCVIKNITLNKGQGVITGGIHLNKIKNITIEQLSSYLTSAEESGGILFLEETKLLLKNSSFRNSTARIGAFVYIGSLGSAVLEGISIEQGEAVNDAGFLYGEDVVDISMTNVNLESIKSEKSASVLYINTFKSLIIIHFFVNHAETRGKGTIRIQSSFDNSLILIDDLVCTYTIAEQGTCLYIEMISPVNISNFLAENNFGSSIIQLNYASLTQTEITSFKVSKCEVDYIVLGSLANLRMTDVSVGFVTIRKFFFFLQESSIYFTKSKIENCSPPSEYTTDSIFYFWHCTNIEVKFFELSNYSQKIAHMFFIDEGQISLSCINVNSTKFSKAMFSVVDSPSASFLNVTIKNSQGLNVMNFTNSNITLQEVKIYRNSNESDSTFAADLYFKGMRGSDITNLTILDSQIEGGVGPVVYVSSLTNFICSESFFEGKNLQGTQLFILEEIYFTLIAQSLFNNSLSNRGSAIIYSNFLTKNSSLNIESSVFTKGRAYIGGSLYFEGLVNFSLEDCIFENNKALQIEGNISGIAGVLYFNCSDTKACSGSLAGSIFTRNEAENFGATIFSESFVTESKIKQNSYENNIDNLHYSNSIGSITNCVVILNETLTSDNDNQCVNSNTLLEIDSGRPFDLEMGLVDFYGRVASYDNRSIISIKSLDSGLNVYYPQENPSVSLGKKTFTQMKINMIPENSAFLHFELELYYPGSSEAVIQTQKLTVRSKICSAGFIIKLDMSCEPCELGTYSWDDPMSIYTKGENLNCKKCPKNFFCPGKNNIYPEKGYYRYSNSSLEAVKCRNPDACTGYTFDSEGQALDQPCFGAHYGIICHECLAGFGKFTGGGLCESCDKDRPLYIIRLVVMIIVVLFYVLLNTYIFTKQVKSSSLAKEITASPFIVFKILFNHLQSMGTMAVNFDFSSFPFFQSFLNLQSYFSIVNEDVISVECIMQSIYSKDYTYIVKVFGLIVLPVGFGVAAFLFWFLLLGIFIVFRLRFSKSVKVTLKKILVSFTIATYLLYPVIIQSVFSLSNCMNLNTGTGEKTYLYMSPNIPCWEGTHWILFMSLFLPSTIIWGIAFPTFLFFILRMSYLSDKNKNTIIEGPELRNNKKISLSKSIQEGNIFRFFYEDYKPVCFYWEIVIFTKKFLLNILISSTELLGIDLNTILKIFLLVGYALIVLKIRPFLLHTCNSFEISSNLIVISSINFLFISEDKAVKSYSMPFLVLILILNATWILMLIIYFIKLAYLKKRNYDSKRKTLQMDSRKFSNDVEKSDPASKKTVAKTQIVKVRGKR